MLRNWRSWTLLGLFLAPYLVYIVLGFLWLKERGWTWVTGAGLVTLLMGVVFTLLLTRWTRTSKSFLPPIDWDAPQTFTDFDRKAWQLVEAEAERGEALDMGVLTTLDTYIDTGRRLAGRLAAHYHPLSSDPIERVPVIELLTALELAAEDLSQLCRQVPGGDLVTAADWKRAVVAANYIQKASDVYTYLLPLFNPVTGVSRLASQHLAVKPAWKNMQQNLLRWFFRAFVNRLGTHLVELYSGRLVIGSAGYRKLTRKLQKGAHHPDPTEAPLVIALVGRKGSGKSSLLGSIGQARAAAAESAGPGNVIPGLDRLRAASVVEVDFYTKHASKESARDRSTRRHAVKQAVEADLLVLVLDIRDADYAADLAFVQDWSRWYLDHPDVVAPPAVAVLTHADAAGLVGDWQPESNWATGQSSREVFVRDKVNALRSVLPPQVADIVVGIPPGQSRVPSNDMLAALGRLCEQAERGAMIRQLRISATQSRTNRLIHQVSEQGKSLWGSIRNRKKGSDGAGTVA